MLFVVLFRCCCVLCYCLLVRLLGYLFCLCCFDCVVSSVRVCVFGLFVCSVVSLFVGCLVAWLNYLFAGLLVGIFACLIECLCV